MRFGPVDIAFDGAVLRPRPWTLAQSQWASELDGPGALLELGCGAGQIGLAATALSRRPVVQVDRDEAACRWAADNAAANGHGAAALQRCGSVDEVLSVDERFTIVIADPPYVPSSEVSLYPEDPLGAIDGGADGLVHVRVFLAVASRHLATGGSVLIQLRGGPQIDALRSWLAEPAAPALTVVEARGYGDDRAIARLVAAA